SRLQILADSRARGYESSSVQPQQRASTMLSDRYGKRADYLSTYSSRRTTVLSSAPPRSGYVLRFSQCLHCSSGVRELAEKRFRASKVGHVEIFGEVAVAPRQQVMCVFAFIQPTP